jgi:GTP-binding protein LepA
VERIGVITPKLVATESSARRDRLHHRLDQGSGRYPRRRHDHRGPAPTAEAAAGFKPASRWCSAGCSPSMRPISRICAPPWASCGSTTPFSFEMETSAALGFGFRCGFLGLLHLEIIQERLEREFNLDLIATAPSVVYRMNMTNGDVIELHNPADMPDVVKIASIEEPWIKATILTPDDYLGADPEAVPGAPRRQTDLTYVGSAPW